jgi:hypothetical protein
MDKAIKSTSKTAKKKLPEGAKVLGTEVRVSVREISNGFIVTKDTETKYQAKNKDYTDWMNDKVEVYSKTDPLEIKIDGKDLASSFD